MKKILLSALLLLFACFFTCSIHSPALAEGNDVEETASQNTLTIWDDVDNLDGSRPEVITSDPIPGYTTERIVHGSQTIFIHHHRPEVSRRSVANELLYADLKVSVQADDPGPDEKFSVRLRLSSPGMPPDAEYTCVIGDNSFTVSDGSVLSISSAQKAIITLPLGTSWSTEQEEKIRYETSVNGEPGYTAEGRIEIEGDTVLYNNTTKLTSFTVLKRWDGAVGESIELTLYADGRPIEAGFFQVDHHYTAENLPLYDHNGRKIIYTATEAYMEGYLTAYVNYGEHTGETEVLYNGGTVINREVAEFRVYKQWVGVDSTNAPAIRLKLYDGNKEMPFSPMRVITPDSDMYVWKLPIAYNTRIPDYYVIEEQMNGCYAEYLGERNDRAYNGETIRNTVIPPTGNDNRLIPWLVCLVGAVIVLMGLKGAGRR